MRCWGLLMILVIFENHQIIKSNGYKILKSDNIDSKGKNTESEKSNDVKQEKGNETAKNITEFGEKEQKQLNLKKKIQRIQGTLKEFFKKLITLMDVVLCGSLNESHERQLQEKKELDQLKKQKTRPYYYNDYYYVNDMDWEPCEME